MSNQRKQVPLRIEGEILELLSEMAAGLKLSRNQLMTAILTEAAECFEILRDEGKATRYIYELGMRLESQETPPE